MRYIVTALGFERIRSLFWPFILFLLLRVCWSSAYCVSLLLQFSSSSSSFFFLLLLFLFFFSVIILMDCVLSLLLFRNSPPFVSLVISTFLFCYCFLRWEFVYNFPWAVDPFGNCFLFYVPPSRFDSRTDPLTLVLAWRSARGAFQ